MGSQVAPTVSIIVVNYCTRQLTLDCLRSIERETRKVDYEILLVDNASNDGIVEVIGQEMPSVRCLPLSANVGFARANNIAAEQAKGRFLLLLNPDTIVLDGAVDCLIAFALNNAGARIWGGQSLRPDNSIDPTSCWRRVTLWGVICRTFAIASAFPNSRILNPEGYGGWDRLSARDVDIVCGCFMLIDRDVWDQLNGFDANFFLYGEEADFCLRAARIGARPAFTPDAKIIHYCGASHQVEAEKLVRGLSARAELIRRHVPAGQRVSLFIHSLLPLVRFVGYGIAARLTRNDDMLGRAETWWRVWLRRATWRLGLSMSSP
jgi:GT2 family glycosyltransferase